MSRKKREELKQQRQAAKAGKKVKKKLKRADAWKKKEWYVIVSPKMYGEKEICETLCIKPTGLIGRTVKVPLREFTGNMNQQFVKILLKVIDVKGKTGYTDIMGFELVREYLRRNIRRRRSMMILVKDVMTKDGRKLRLTIYIFGGQKIGSDPQKMIRAAVGNIIKQEAENNSFEQFFQKIATGQTSSIVYKEVKKLHRISRIEISKAKIM